MKITDPKIRRLIPTGFSNFQVSEELAVLGIARKHVLYRPMELHLILESIRELFQEERTKDVH